MKTMLLAVSGMSPAVITETLYGINKRGEAWPQSVKIITTSLGAERMWAGLVWDGHLAALCRELDKPLISLEQGDILVVPDAAGNPVVDARSEADHEALANFIVTTVRDCTEDPHAAIHASIAGGRKTMTFYLGYAMSLFGRHFDCLSHVLVSEGYENHPDFFYPTRDSRFITLNDGSRLDAKEAQVTLADIPFIRQRQLIPELLKGLGETVNFRHLVNLINLGDQPELLRLDVDPAAQCLKIRSSKDPQLGIEIEIANSWHWAFYLLLVEESLQPPEMRGNYIRPIAGKPDDLLATAMAIKLAEINGIDTRGGTATEIIDELLAHDGLWSRNPLIQRSLKPVRDKGGVTNDHFSNYITSLQKLLSDKLPANLVQWLIPTQIFDENGERLEGTGKIKHKGGGYGIPLPNPERQIRLSSV